MGGKAAGLDRLVAAGERVPAYVVLGPDDDLGPAHRIGPGPFAVRSSAENEDGQRSAQAGRYASFLNVSTAELPDRVRRVRASFGEYPGAVIIQHMVPAEVSGVAFSVHPAGILDQVVVSAGAGPGAVVADGGPSRTWVTSIVDGQCYSHGDAPEDLLTSARIDEIVAAVRRIHDREGRPVDIEWALAGGVLYLLQARPVTSLRLGQVTTLDNSNLVESYPGLVTPLTASFVARAYAGVFRGLAERITRDPAIVAAFDDVFPAMVAVTNGRLYYRMESWYAVLALMPLARRYIRIWQDSLGISDRSYRPPSVRLGPVQRLRTALGILRELRRTPMELGELADDVAAVRDRFRPALAAARSVADLRSLLEEIEVRLLQRWDVTLLNDVRAFVFPALLKLLVRDDAEVHRLVSGITAIESLRPVRALEVLAAEAPADLADITTADQAAVFLAGDDDYAVRLREFVDEFGDRSLAELKLESPTFRTDSLLLVRTLVATRDSPGTRGSGQQSISPKRYRSPWVRALARRATSAIAARESSRLDRARVYAMVRGIAHRAGDLLTSGGRIDRPDDIWWLHFEEIWSDRDDLRTLIATRRRDHDGWRSLPAFRRITFAGEPFDTHVHATVEAPHPRAEPVDIAGLGVSGGSATGEVVIVDDPHEVGDVAGRILVTTITDPGWVFLLSRAAGIIAERGSLLSHTAIVARELGIPAVVGIANATAMLRPGELVTVDGDRGEVLRRWT